MNNDWRIDAFDSRGGLAFASYREAELLPTDPYSTDGPAVFIQAPDFQIENVSGRAIGLASGNRSFQIGLFVNGAEVGFAALEDLVEFVRRCYLRGAGGDGTDAGGGGLPRTPDEGPAPDIPELPDLEYEPKPGDVAGLRADIEKFVVDSKGIAYLAYQPVKAALSPWNRGTVKCSLKAAEIAVNPIERLVRGALSLILEMLRRYPVRGSDADIVRWDGTAKTLGRALFRLGLHLPLLESPYQSILSAPINEVARLAALGREQNLLQLCSHPHDPWEIFDFLFGPGRYPSWWNWLDKGWYTRLTDPIDDVCRWPVPKELSVLTGVRNKDFANVLGLMAAIQSTPQVFAGGSNRSANTALEIVMFAAAYIVSDGDPDVLLRSGVFPDDPTPTYSSPARLHDLRIKAAAESGCSWLIEQMPQLVFPPEIEKVIEETAERSYDD